MCTTRFAMLRCTKSSPGWVPVMASAAEGLYVWDTNGKRYLTPSAESSSPSSGIATHA